MNRIDQIELRELENIEEDQMRNIFQLKTGIQVPIHIMYLDLGRYLQGTRSCATS